MMEQGSWRAAVGLACALPLAAVAAGDQTYTSEAAFSAALSGPVLVEGFEDVDARTRSSATLSTSLLAVVVSADTLGVQDGPLSPEDGFGSYATDGTHYAFLYAPSQPVNQVRFDLGTAVTGFAFDLTDIEVLGSHITLTTDRGAFAGGVLLEEVIGNSGSGSLRFLGVTQSQSFTQVTLTFDGVDDAFGIDRLQLAPVPEPGTLAMMAGGLALLAGRRRRAAA